MCLKKGTPLIQKKKSVEYNEFVFFFLQIESFKTTTTFINAITLSIRFTPPNTFEMASLSSTTNNNKTSSTPFHHTLTTDQVLSFFGVESIRTGLTEKQCETNLKLYGRNELPAEEGTPLWKLVLKQFDDVLVKVRRSESGGLR